MPRRKVWPPTILKHRGQDRIRVNGRDFYLGPCGSEESKREYARLIVVLANDKTPPPRKAQSLTVADLVARWLAVVDAEYDAAGGEPKNFRLGVKPLVAMFGQMQAGEFDAKCLEAVMVGMATGSWMPDVDQARAKRRGKIGWCRRVVGRQTTRIRTMWAWAEKQHFVPAGSTMHLRTATLSERDKRVRKSDPRKAATWEQIQAVMPFVPAPVAAMLHLQWLIGVRPDELCLMRTMDIDRSDAKVWTYVPGSELAFGRHKNAWRGQSRTIHLGRRSQLLLTPWLNESDPTAFIFRLSRGQGHYTPGPYANAVRKACKRAGIEPFVPYQLRHAAKRRVERLAGTGGAKAFLGQESIESTKQYASQQDQELAKELARKLS